MNFNFGSDRSDRQKHQPAPFSTVPFAPDPDLVDRPAIAAWVRDKCAGPGARAALVGLGGVGKSQLALQYAHRIRHAAQQTFVFWVHASTRARFEEAYRDIAGRLELPGRDDPKANVLQLVHDWLRDEANGRWFMVVDNVDDVDTFFPAQKCQRQGDEADASAQIPLNHYLPQSCNGAILVTSRSKDAATRLAGGYNRIQEVFAMDKSEGLQLLRNKLQAPLVEESAVDLLHELNCIPLAVVQAAAYINRRGRMTIAGYLDEFQRNSKKRERLLSWDAGELRRDQSASNSVVTTWQMSFEQIRHERRSAAELLSLMSFFNPQGILWSVLRRHSIETARRAGLEDEEDADSAFEEDLDTLQAYSLVLTTAYKDTCEMHALVQFCTRVWLSSCSDAEQWEQRFVALMAQELPTGEHENWVKCQQLLPHVEPLFITQPASEDALEAWAQVLTNAAWYLWNRGSYSVAQQVAAKAVAAREKALGREDRQTLTSVVVLALVLQAQGKYEEAETLNRRALEGWEKKLGEDHPDTLTSVYCLAHLLHTLCRQPSAANADINRGKPFRMTAPLVASITMVSAVSETAAATPPGDPSIPTNHGAIIGGLIGAFCCGILLVLIATYLKRSRSKRKDEEKGHHTEIIEEQHNHVQRDTQNQPPRVFQTYDVDPVTLANAQNWQGGPGILVSDGYGKRDQIHRTSGDSSFGVPLADLAQAQGWNLSFCAANFQPRQGNTGSQDPTRSVMQNLAKRSRPSDQMPPMSYHTRYAGRDRSGSPFSVGDPRYAQTRYANRSRSVSPFTVDDMRYDRSSPRDYDDVSLCDSPILPRRQSR
ncbi:TPR-like protein [Stemphylium lycopersici]|nr:TPR-like protein [Stemphylium lycopersici]